MENLEKPEHRLMEAEFFAEDEMITIIPVVNVPRMTFIQGEYGPFYPGDPSVVPLWLALAMKRARKCKLVIPKWMESKELEKLVEAERASKNKLTKVHFYYAEIAALLLHHGGDDIRSPAIIRRGIEDLSSLRFSKLRRFMQTQINEPIAGVRIENLGSSEISYVRPLLSEVLGTLYYTKRESNVDSSKQQFSTPQTASGSQSKSIYSAGKQRTLRRFQRN